MVRAITELGAEVCCTLGMLTACQAQRLKEAGLYAYNHNLDTSEGFYKSIITTRTYEDRLRTLDLVRESGMTICCGGILGIGETVTDRLQLILTLCRRDPHPESVPINKLSPTPGTPFGDYPLFPTLDMVRIIALARITMPHAMVRLAAGRQQMSLEEQALCFMAGANSLFYCEKFLVTPNAPMDQDDLMFERFKIQKRPAYA
jgi:biotin synthase